MKSIPFLSLHAQHQLVRDDVNKAFLRVYDNNSFVLGKELESFESALASFCQTDHALGVGNGLDALTIALKALKIGVGDEVIVPAHTYLATWLAITRVGAIPVPVEPDDTLNIDPTKITDAISTRTRVILPVHLYGQACDMTSICAIAEKNNLNIVEDNAQAIGARWSGRRTGSFGIVNATSFYPTKNLGAMGDGGAITTSNAAIADFVKQYRSYGFEEKNRATIEGVNSRLDEVQAAILSTKLLKLETWTLMRQTLAMRYSALLNGVGDIIFQDVKSGADHVYHLYVIQTKQRDRLKDFLKANGIETMIHYPIPPHLQKAFQHLDFKKSDFSKTENLAQTLLSLPLYPGLAVDDVDYVCDQIVNFFK